MRGERMKEAVQQIEKNAHYATTGSACRRAMQEDTPEAYHSALREIVNSSNRSGEYGVNIDKAERAIREDR
jgi:hypothetical protein